MQHLRYVLPVLALVALLGVVSLLPQQSTHAQDLSGVVAFVGTSATTGSDIYILDIGSGQVGQLGVEAREGKRPVWQPSGEWLAFTTADGGYGVLNGLDGCFSGARVCEDVTTFSPDENIVDVAWSPDGAWLLLLTADEIKLVSPLATSLDFALSAAADCPGGFELYGEEAYVLCLGADEVSVMEMGMANNQVTLTPHYTLGTFPELTALAIGPLGASAVGTQETVGDSGHVADITGAVSRIASIQIHIYDLAYAPDGTLAVAGATADSTGDGTLRDGDLAELYQYDATGTLGQVQGLTGARGLAWSPSGDRLLVITGEQEFKLYTAATGSATALTVSMPAPGVAAALPAWKPGEAPLPMVPAATQGVPVATQGVPAATQGVAAVPPTAEPLVYPTFTPRPAQPTARPTSTPRPTITPRPSATPGSPMGTGCQYSYGNGTLPVEIGDTAEVTDWGVGLRLRAAPGLNERQIRELPRGARMTILDGPVCSSGYRWWEVRLDDGTVGWLGDSDQVGWWIESVSSPYYVQFRANPSTIQPGGCATLEWSMEGIQQVYYLGDGSLNEGVTGYGSRSVCPSTTTTYQLRVVHQDGSTTYPSATVIVSGGGGGDRLDYTLPAAHGSVSLAAGFLPDPYQVQVTAGGSLNAEFAADFSCRGGVERAPDFELRYTGDIAQRLRFYFESPGDTTLVINGPSGGWYCNDDYGGSLSPMVEFLDPREGTYDIWVGTYASSGGDYITGTLNITERSSLP
ncbi:MAG: SH3 domain-containing protein [Chloroflexi bacterium]|nr:SH3 domain-containing protein [Chloroflexota bacterium]